MRPSLRVAQRAFKRANRARSAQVLSGGFRAARVSSCAAGGGTMFNLFGRNETDGLARLAGILYVLVLPTAGPWYYTSTALLAGATPEKLEAARSTLGVMILLGAAGHTLQLVAAVLLYLLLK